MPIYEYRCDKCGVFEVTQRITEDPLKKCPTCKSKVERIISATSFVLKGSGWYITDYARSGSSGPKSESSSESSPSSGSSAASKGESNSSPAKSSESSKSSGDKATAKTAD